LLDKNPSIKESIYKIDTNLIDYKLNKTIISLYGRKLLLLSEEKIFLISLAKIDKLKAILYTNKLKNDIFLGIMDFNSIYKNQYLISSRNIFKFRYVNELKHFENILIALSLKKNKKNNNQNRKFKENFKGKIMDNITIILKKFEKFRELRNSKRQICKICESNFGKNIENKEKYYLCIHNISKRPSFSLFFDLFFIF
jgi:hypothetical protein